MPVLYTLRSAVAGSSRICRQANNSNDSQSSIRSNSNDQTYDDGNGSFVILNFKKYPRVCD